MSTFVLNGCDPDPQSHEPNASTPTPTLSHDSTKKPTCTEYRLKKTSPTTPRPHDPDQVPTLPPPTPNADNFA